MAGDQEERDPDRGSSDKTRFWWGCTNDTSGPGLQWIKLVTGKLKPESGPPKWGWAAFDPPWNEIAWGPALNEMDGKLKAIAWAKGRGYTTQLDPQSPWGCPWNPPVEG